MNPLLPVLDPVLPFALAATTALYLADFVRGEGRRRARGSRTLLGVTLTLMLARFGVFVAVLGRPPLANPAEGFTTIALAIVVVYAILELVYRERSTGFLLLAIATLFQVFGTLSDPAGAEVNVVLRKPWFGFHAVTAILGYTAFAVGAVYSTLFLFLYGDLKRRRFGLIYDRVPSLEILSRMAFRAVFLGFVFLTVAIAVGAFGWIREMERPVLGDPKVVSTLIVWCVYGIAVSLHRFTGWRGIRSIRITLAAFLLMVLSSWLVPLVLGSAHSVKELI